MKRFYFLFLLLASLASQAQVETEPNNDFATANPLAASATRTGTVNNSTDPFDYYMAILPTDGTFKIYVQATNTSATGGYLYMSGFDRRKASGTVFNSYIGSTNTPAGVSIMDTITVYGQAADTFYVRIQATANFSYSLRYEMADTSPNDAEPNNIFDNVVPIAYQEIKQGHIGYRQNGTSDLYDYYRAIMPTDGTLKIYVQGRNNDGFGGYLYMSGYDRRKANGTVFNSYIRSTSTPMSTSISDTITVYGRAADTFYFRLESSAAFSYSIRYEMVDTSPNDAEPNGSFTEVIPISQGETKQGHIGYRLNGTTDTYDYYRTVLPSDGTLKIYVQGRNNDGFGGYLYMSGYDRRKANGTVFNSYIRSTSTSMGTSISDTITVYGRAADTFYFRLESSAAFSYSISYAMVDTSVNDVEPNGSFTEVIPINQGETKQGHIGYRFNGTTDTYDHYKTVLPSDGTLKIYVQGRNNDGFGGYLYMSGYDRRKAGGTVFNSYINSTSTAPGVSISDTITVQCVAADTFYFRFESSAAFSYQVKYEVTLGVDTTIRVCPGYTTSISGLYNTSPFSTVKYENMASPGAAISPNAVGVGLYRLSVYNGIECTRDTAFITVAANPKPNLGADTTVKKCIGYAADIRTAKNTTGYALVEWSTPRPDSVETGTYTLIVTNQFGCKDTVIITVDNYPKPNLGADKAVSKCPGFTTDITTLYSTGIYTAVQWSTTTPAAVDAGVYTLIVTNEFGCRDTAVVTVTNYPKPNIGPDRTQSICTGFTYNLTSLFTNAALTYSWNTPTPTAATAGTYTVIATNTNGCQDTALVTISNYAQPVTGFTINSSQQCLKGNSFSFTSTSTTASGTLTYQWQFGDNGTDATANTTHVYTAAGTYAVKLITTSNNGCRDSITQNITVNPSPDLGADQTVALTCYGATTNLTTLYNTSSYATVSYSTTTPTTAPAGVYNLVVATAAGCRDTAIITVTGQPIAVVPTAGANTKMATRECTDAQGWTHYYNDNGTAANLSDDILVLSIRKNGNNIGTTGTGSFMVKTVAITGAGSNTGVAVTNAALAPYRFWAMNRYWEVTPTTQPTSAVGVRFYHTMQDFADISGSYPAAGMLPQNLVLYKAANGNADPATNLAGATSISKLTYSSSSASTTTFTYTALNSTMQYAEFQVSSFSGGGAGVVDSLRPLPLKLVHFTATLKNAAVTVDWKTTDEVNVARFVIQRSTDGRSFQTIGSTPSAGRSSASYAFTDVDALKQNTRQLYYRLQVFDKDGSSYYSAIAAVQLPAQNTFSISPNPATSLVYVKGTNLKQVQIIDNRGRVVLSQIASNSSLQTISVSHLAKGLYLLKITDSSGYSQTEKLLVQ